MCTIHKGGALFFQVQLVRSKHWCSTFDATRKHRSANEHLKDTEHILQTNERNLRTRLHLSPAF